MTGAGPGGPPAAGRLPCGADVDELLEQVAAGHARELTSHQQHCPHCQASLSELDRLWAPVRAQAAASAPAPPSLVEGVMTGVRRMVRDTWYTLELTDGGSLRVAARVVAVLARDAARRVPGVRAALGRSSAGRIARLVERGTLSHRHPHSAIGVLGRTAVVDLALAVEYGPALPEVARWVQEEVVAELRRGIGLKSVTVNVTVDDVFVADRDST